MPSDRRTVATHNQTGEFSILTDHATKLFLGPYIAVALVGGSDVKTADPASLIQNWLTQTYQSDANFRDQVHKLWDDRFKDGHNGGFVAATYRNGVAESFRFDGHNESTYTRLADEGHAKLQLNGSGNQIVGDILDQHRPQIARLSLSQIAALSGEIIRKTHRNMTEQKLEKITVGPQVTSAVIDERGSHLIDTTKAKM